MVHGGDTLDIHDSAGSGGDATKLSISNFRFRPCFARDLVLVLEIVELKDETRHRTCTCSCTRCTSTSTSAGTRAIFITLLELLHLVWVLVSTEPWGNMDYNSIGTLDLSSLWLCDVAAP